MNNPLLNNRWIRTIYFTIKSLRTFYIDHAYLKSFFTWSGNDKQGQPIPWFTFPAIEFLKQFDFSSISIFEYGSGDSTLFWAQRAKRVVSIEDNSDWYLKIKPQLPGNVTYHLLGDKEAYIESINQNPEELFDIIIVDGNYRMECAKTAYHHLSQEGFIILDNSDWYPETSAFLRGMDLVEIDMTGFTPRNYYVSTTSLYLKRDVHFKPATNQQPVPGIGSYPGSAD